MVSRVLTLSALLLGCVTACVIDNSKQVEDLQRQIDVLRAEKTGTESRIRLPPPEATRKEPTEVRLPLQWVDHAIFYDGLLVFRGNDVSINAALFDIQTRTLIARRRVNVEILRDGRDAFALVTQFAVPGDSVTPQPHVHLVNLVFQSRAGQWIVRNCPEGKCYPAQSPSDSGRNS